jgi:N-formylglutamate amidohydrolase
MICHLGTGQTGCKSKLTLQFFQEEGSSVQLPPLPDLPPTGTHSGEKLPLRNATLPTAQTGKDHYIHYLYVSKKNTFLAHATFE